MEMPIVPLSWAKLVAATPSVNALTAKAAASDFISFILHTPFQIGLVEAHKRSVISSRPGARRPQVLCMDVCSFVPTRRNCAKALPSQTKTIEYQCPLSKKIEVRTSKWHAACDKYPVGNEGYSGRATSPED
jgi:hypothetical protein